MFKWDGRENSRWVKLEDSLHVELPTDTLLEVEVVQELRGEVITVLSVDLPSWVVVGSILHGGPIEVFLVQSVFHDWCMSSPVCGVVRVFAHDAMGCRIDPL